MKIAQLLLLIIAVSLFGCRQIASNEPPDAAIDFRQEMRNFIIALSRYAKSHNADFLIIPQNGQELITDNGEGDGLPQRHYLQAIDATGRENMFYGYDDDDEATADEDSAHLVSLCLLCEQHGVEVLATDYAFTNSKMDDAYAQNERYGFISFTANERELNNIPDYPAAPHNENNSDIGHITQAKNFLYLINMENFPSKQDFIRAVSDTNYDLIIMDLYYDEESFSALEINQLKIKQNGGKRLVVCYMSIGEAEDYRYYWQPDWQVGDPSWLDKEDPDWKGNYYVRYWEAGWQNIIYGNENAYLKKILDAGFDGVYLDLVDAFEYYED